jgi:hypothetical protein
MSESLSCDGFNFPTVVRGASREVTPICTGFTAPLFFLTQAANSYQQSFFRDAPRISLVPPEVFTDKSVILFPTFLQTRFRRKPPLPKKRYASLAATILEVIHQRFYSVAPYFDDVALLRAEPSSERVTPPRTSPLVSQSPAPNVFPSIPAYAFLLEHQQSY